MHRTESLCCTPETNTHNVVNQLYISINYIKGKLRKKKKHVRETNSFTQGYHPVFSPSSREISIIQTEVTESPNNLPTPPFSSVSSGSCK